MFRRFLRDRRGNFMMITAISMVVLFGALTVGVDYAQMSRQRQNTLNALDAAGIATARRILEGASDAVVRTYARDFFDANLSSVRPQDVTLTVTLPANVVGGGKVRLDADMLFRPHFLPAFLGLMGKTPKPIRFHAATEVRLKNTVEVAMVLDNSGSMSENGKGTGKPRIDLLKSAATQLVDQLAASAALMAQVEKPVQFSVVPFAASVNIGSGNRYESWMDTTGISPIHHENLDWSKMPSSKKVEQLVAGGPYLKTGSSWPAAQKNTPATRFTLFDDMQRYVCSNGTTTCPSPTLQSFTPWGGCVETRPFPYNTNDAAATTANTYFVPMFAPDEAGDFRYADSTSDNLVDFDAYNTWWYDSWANKSNNSTEAKGRQRNTAKYYTPLPKDAPMPAGDKGPNGSCTTKAITPLADVTKAAGLKTIKDAINAMSPGGATNVPEGLAWGWRTLSSQAPFTGGRSEVERGNDKVVIVLTDGANTYYTPSSLGSTDTANNKSIYSAYGYTQLNDNSTGRIFSGTSSSVSKSDFSNDNYSKAMNEQLTATCVNANGGDTGGRGAGLIVMTVALDLDKNSTVEKAQMAMLEKCASRSRYSKDPTDPTKGRRLYWNATGANLSQVFKEIADELSNLRIVM